MSKNIKEKIKSIKNKTAFIATLGVASLSGAHAQSQSPNLETPDVNKETIGKQELNYHDVINHFKQKVGINNFETKSGININDQPLETKEWSNQYASITEYNIDGKEEVRLSSEDCHIIISGDKVTSYKGEELSAEQVQEKLKTFQKQSSQDETNLFMNTYNKLHSHTK